MRRYLWVAALTISAAAQSQKIPDPRSFANTITADDLKKHLYIVAGKEMEGRETATDGERKAAAYIEAQFRSFGLAPGNNGSYQMMWPLFRDSLLSASMEVNGKEFAPDKDFAVNLSTAHTTNLLGGEVVFVGSGYGDSARDDYKGINARGKIVLVLPGGTPQGGGRGRGGFGPVLDAAMKNGAAAVL